MEGEGEFRENREKDEKEGRSLNERKDEKWQRRYKQDIKVETDIDTIIKTFIYINNNPDIVKM